MGEILFLAHRMPWPPDRGDKIRSHHILRKLMELAPVHLACFADDERDMQFGREISDRFASSHVEIRSISNVVAGLQSLASRSPVSLKSFASSAMQRYVDDICSINDISAIFVFSGQMAQYVPTDFSGRIVMDFVDVDSAKFESYAEGGSGPMAWVNKREGELLKAFEHQAAKRADISLFVSEAEAALFRQRSGLPSDRAVPLGNGIDLKFYDPSALVVPANFIKSGPLIIFTGQMDYRPNVEAVESFSNEVMPRILQHHVNAQFAIVGRSPTAVVQRLDGENGTIVVGAVDDVRSWLNLADIVVAPLRIARGIQNKVLEAMAMGKPVVASTAAAEGINAQHDVHLMVATNVTEESDYVSQLIGDPQKSKNLGAAARQQISDNYSWQGQLAGLSELVGFDHHSVVEAAE